MLLALIAWAVTVSVCILFVIRPWLPAGISAHAVAFDGQLAGTMLACGILFVLAQAGLGFAILRFRDRGRAARYLTGSRRLELAITTASATLFFAFAFTGSRIFANVALPPGSLRVEVLGHQFAWSFRYPGDDGRFGRTSLTLVNDAGGNPFGLDRRDPAAADDVVSATLKVPVGRPVRLLLHSRDVIHSFFVRELRLKQDLVPGMEIPLDLRADTPGIYEIPCSELCGLGHQQMRSTFEVLSEAEFQQWLHRARRN
jgi:cytochrome c oxidase subunit II